MKKSKKIIAAFLAALMLMTMFSFSTSAASAITEANALFAKPRAGELPPSNVEPEGTTYKTYLVGWYTKDEETGVYTEVSPNSVLKKNTTYYVRVAFYAKSSDYVLTDNTKYKINDRSTTAVEMNKIEMENLTNSILGLVSGYLGVVVREAKYKGLSEDGPTDELGSAFGFVQKIVDMIKGLINQLIEMIHEFQDMSKNKGETA